MSRYRKLEVRTWSDAKFMQLSPMPPSGQGLWLYLLSGPHTGPIPGLFRTGRAAMAEELNWDIKAFDKAFGEVLAQGMVKADFESKLVWIPNAIKHNKPESPNVVRNWGKEFDLLPECQLKTEALIELKSFIDALGEGYKKAFKEAFAEYLAKPLPKTMPNQEQEQEQEYKRYCAPKNLDSDDVPKTKETKPKTKKSGLDFSSWPEEPSDQVLKDWIKVRKAALTQTAVNLMARELHSAAAGGMTVDDCLGLCTVKCWRGFKYQWALNANSDNPGYGQQPPDIDWDDTSWADGLVIEIPTGGQHQ